MEQKLVDEPRTKTVGQSGEASQSYVHLLVKPLELKTISNEIKLKAGRYPSDPLLVRVQMRAVL